MGPLTSAAHFLSFLLFVSLFLQCDEKTTNPLDGIDAITFDEIYEQKIMTFVDKEINLVSKVYWRYPDITVNRLLGSSTDTSFASPPRLKFENADDYIQEDIWKNQERGDIFLKSPNMIKIVDENLAEQYCYFGALFSNYGRTYVMKGKIEFRDIFQISQDQLKDSTFIAQNNNVVYWGQMFEFRMDTILVSY